MCQIEQKSLYLEKGTGEEVLDLKNRALNEKAVADPLPLPDRKNTRTYTQRLHNTQRPLTVMCPSDCCASVTQGYFRILTTTENC